MSLSKAFFGKDTENNSKYILKRQLRHFVSRYPELDKSAYGEIMFIECGRKPSFSSYVTVKHDVDSSILWTLFISYWKLFVPHVIVSTVGNFTQQDDHWRDISKKSWIFTKGSSPMYGYCEDTCIIAVIPSDGFCGNECLISDSDKGLFPAIYQPGELRGSKCSLDSHHTHFIFVDGTSDEVMAFRERLLHFLGSKNIQFDSTRTKIIQIPVLAKVVSNDNEEFLHAARMLKRDHLVIVNEKADEIAEFVTQVNAKRGKAKFNRASALWQEEELCSLENMTSRFKNEDEKSLVTDFFQLSHLKKIVIYPSPTCPSLQGAILQSLMSSKRYCQQTATRLALIWDRVDLLKNYFLKKNMNQDSTFFPACLHLALTLNRPEFLELIYDTGLNVYSTLTGILTCTIRSSGQYIVQTYLKKCNYQSKDLLREIGQFVSFLTNEECENIYSDPLYVFEDAKRSQDQGSFERSLVVDNTPCVPYPERDLFIWCIFTGNNELAKILWRHGSDYLCSALLASVLYDAEALFIEHSSEESLATENLKQYSKDWEGKSIELLRQSCAASESATQSQIVANIAQLGGCSCVTLAHAGNRHSFMALGHVQRVLDIVWNGCTKSDTSYCVILLVFFLPFLIPFMNILRTQEDFTYFSNQVYKPLFSAEPARKLRSRCKTIPNSSDGIQNFKNRFSFVSYLLATGSLKGLMSVKKSKNEFADYPDIPRTGSRIRSSATLETQTSTYVENTTRRKIKAAFYRIYSFYNSPRITFIGHSINLILTILILSAILIIMNVYRNKYILELNLLWLFWYMLGNLFEDLRKLVCSKATTIGAKMRLWASDVWNVCHAALLVCYFTGFALHQISHDDYTWYWSKILYSICLMFLYIRALRIYTVSKLLGPVLQMIKRMMNDMIAFVAIVALLFWCYGLILHTLQTENMPQSDVHAASNTWGSSFQSFAFALCNYVIREPFWQIFGDLLGDATKIQSTFPGLVRATCTGIYVLFTTLLMINLLIAMFSYTFENIQENSYEVWAYYRYRVVQEFADRPILASPLIIFAHAARLIFFCRKNSPSKCAFKRSISKQEMELRREFEFDVMNDLINEETNRESQDKTMLEIKNMQEKLKTQIEQLTMEMRK